MPALPAPLPSNEAERLAKLASYEVLDTKPEEAYDDIVRIASQICETPIALVSFVGAERQWFKARVGLDATETPRDLAFCAHAILQEQVFEVPNALEDSRFATNPLVTADPSIRFYAGAPLDAPGGLRLGTLCVIDMEPRQLSEGQRAALAALARQVVSQLELRLHLSKERALRDQREKVIGELEVMSEFKSRLVATVSHEMRSPLTSMLGSLRLLEEGIYGELPAEAKSAVEVAARNAGRLARLSDDLLDLQSLQACAGPTEQVRIETSELLHAVRDELLNFRPEIEIKVEFDPTAPATMTGDPDRLRQVLINLTANALRFSPAGGRVTLRSLAGSDRALRLEVQDQGPGISLEDQAKLFLPFSQVGDTKHHSGGAGLGLAISHSIVVLHEGRIGCESEPGQGAVFYLEL